MRFVVVAVVVIAVAVVKEQHEQAKFCFNLWKTTTELYQMLKTVHDEALSCTHVFEWFIKFRQGHDDLKDDPRSEWLSTAQNLETATVVYESVTRDG